jgi:hypothetical protein
VIVNYYETVGGQGRINSSLAREMCHSPVDKRRYLVDHKKRYLFGVTGKLACQMTPCPLAPIRGAMTKFSSKDAFFRSCRAKIEELSSYNSKEGKRQKKHKQCLKCKQAAWTKKGKLVLELADIGIVVDKGMTEGAR